MLVTGPNANSMRTLNGGWSLSWQGEKVDSYAQEYNTILEAIENKVGKERVVYEAGVTYKEGGLYWEENTPEIQKAVNAARGVDYIILCLGETSYCETPGNLDDLYLSENQQQLAKALAATGKPVILILNEGRPRVISKIEPMMQAIVQIYLPGNYGGMLWQISCMGKLIRVVNCLTRIPNIRIRQQPMTISLARAWTRCRVLMIMTPSCPYSGLLALG